MFKRSESTPQSSRPDRSERAKKKRRLMMEGLEQRQLLAVFTDLPTQPAPVVQEYTTARNIGAVQAFQFAESETTVQTGLNDYQSQADLVPLGTGAGQQNTIDVIGALPISTNPVNGSGFSGDIDTFSFNLRGGDILDIATQGAAGGFTVRDVNGSILFGRDTPIAGLRFPLQNQGNANGAMVIPHDGLYTLTVAGATSPLNTAISYKLGLRTYRPTSEQLAVGDAQILYLDFAGALIDNNIFNDVLIQANPGLPVGGVTRVRSLADSLPILGMQLGDTATANRIIDDVVAGVVRIFEELGTTGSNGDYEATGNVGDYGLRVLNSRDNAGQINLNDPRVTRLLIGGTGIDFGLAGVYGIAQSVDIGNLDLSEFGVFALDAFAQTAPTVPIAPGSSQIDLVSTFLASVAAHEAAHTFGMLHTDNTDSIGTLSDAGGTQNANDYGQGLGPDLIFGTLDDIQPGFHDDFYHTPEGFFGIEPITASLSHALSTGTVGGSLAGHVFNDANSNGSSVGDNGLGGVTVFADANHNGLLDSGEASAVSNASGDFTLSVGPGSVTVVAITPTNFIATTPTTVSTTVAVGGSASVAFGFHQVSPTFTGIAFSDNNGNGTREASEAGVAGIFHYLDLDGDNRPDVGEPSAISAADGSYTLNFPGSGTYTIRQAVPPGFTQTSPVGGEYTFFYDGLAVNNNFDFGLRPSRDFGDAPDSYGTTLAAGGASHGITAGLTIGSAVDQEADGQPTSAANGDDLNGRTLPNGSTEDDEDGVRLLEPLGPGASADFEITVNNTTGTVAYLQGFMDFNRDGDFTDAGEQFLSNILIPNGSVNLVLDGNDGIFVNVPANAAVGTTYARFRISQQIGVGPTGSVGTGEVEDYTFPILSSAQIANNDEFSVSRNTLSNQLDVLRNDFETVDNRLTIQNLNTTGTSGIVTITADRRSVLYTPPNGFIGRDAFNYTVFDQFGNTSTATVVVNVTFQSAVPIALDDTFEVPQGSVNRALNVLDNDVPSTSGGLSIISVTPGSAGGTISIIGGGQSLRYTPLPGFNGTEQFTYSVQDSLGLTSTAQVTINLLPGSRADDVVDFTIGLFDPVNRDQEITNVQVGDEFLVRVSVEDIEEFANPRGVASAFLDLLYSDELVATLNTDSNPDFPFDIEFGPLFSGSGVLQRGNAQIPGLIDEVGGVQRIDALQPHFGPVELFTLKMQAVSPGVAVFTGDPADNNISETVTLGSDVALLVNQLRLGTAELLIVPSSDNFTSAIDDSYPEGRDSDGNLISSASIGRNRLDVLANDNLGPTGVVREFGLVTNPTFGSVLIDDNGTPTNLNDDFFSYRPNVNANGLEQFTYVIVTDDGIRSTAKVTIPLGNTNANADVAINFALVNQSGTPIANNQINVGDRVGVQVIVEDLRANPTFVFAGFLDMMYDSGILQPSDTNFADNFDFDVVFGNGYSTSAGVGTAARNGIIDEFGTLFGQATVPDTSGLNPGLLATVFFNAVGAGQTSVVGGPADSSPFQDTLLFQNDDPVPVSKIRYDSLTITVNSGLSGSTPVQNLSMPQDVNNDGFVTPIDALIVINEMSRAAFEGESPSGSLVASQFFTDVNGDTRVSALDALQVINYLAVLGNQQPQGEGEAIAAALAPLNTGTDLQSSTAADEVFADLNDSDLVTDASATSSAAAQAVIAATGDDDADDKSEDMLNLLADDVFGLWS